MTSRNDSLFISCAPDLENILADELTELGISAVDIGYRGVLVNDWNWSTIYKINYASRIASRVLLPLSRFKCYDSRSLYKNAMEIDWSPFFGERTTFAIDANVQHRELRNGLYAAQVVKDAICDQIRQKRGKRPSVDVQNPDVQLNLFIQQQHAVISFDTSGAPLHKRGYRQESVEAPLQESLAAAILRIAGFSTDTLKEIVFDPCCGSGTFLIEAALYASKTPPGYLRKNWGFMKHPSFDAAAWLSVRNSLDAHRLSISPGFLFGIDRSQSAVRACKINLKAAGFSTCVEVQQADFREFEPEVPPHFLITNPPHGRRLEEEDLLRPLYRALGDFMKRKSAKPGRGFIFTSNMELAKEVGLAASRRVVLKSGGLDSRLLEYDLF